MIFPLVDGERNRQLVLGLEEQQLGPDLHDGGRLHRHGDAEERQLRLAAAAVGDLLAVESLTRKPEELSSRQRKRHTKLLSRKEEFSGGSCSGLYITAPPQLCRPEGERAEVTTSPSHNSPNGKNARRPGSSSSSLLLLTVSGGGGGRRVEGEVKLLAEQGAVVRVDELEHALVDHVGLSERKQQQVNTSLY
ncbi:hypothetical protein EYF80_051864 [Liparis tanakae]|uniref:Uncharacterized protein n=1 Tax=Liparis tanakae TaxID=230148 RepID=A0A4Z2F9Y8_9TELE|nr:hypothetical protein EYF80_051864 [Liparis tanakae]